MKSLIDGLLTLFKTTWNILELPFWVLCMATLFILFLHMYWYIYLKYQEKLYPQSSEGKHYKVKKVGIFKQISLAMKQLAKDKLTRDPSEFKTNEGRIVAFCGFQGQGKTVSMTKKLMDYQAEWPLLKVATNYDYKMQNAEITKWQDMTELDNKEQGYILAIDEAQQYWNSRDFRNFDIGMLQEITTQRKQNKVILMTTQSFQFLDKNIRCQVQEIHQCHTILGVFTFVVVKRPIMTYDGNVEKLKFLRIYSFAHTEELRKSYDTLKVIKTVSQKGFVPKNEQLGVINNSNEISINIDNDKKKKKK